MIQEQEIVLGKRQCYNIKRIILQKCKAIELAYFPNDIVSYDFSEELKEIAKNFAKDAAFEGFEGIMLNLSDDDNLKSINTRTRTSLGLSSEQSLSIQEIEEAEIDNKSLGWINTTPVKSFKIIRSKPNKIEGYLYAKFADQVRENSLLKIVTNENTI